MKILKSKLFLTLLIVMSFVVTASVLMPRPIDMNLDKIGNGQKSVVFAYDLNLTVSNKQTIEINKARKLVGDDVNFLVVKVGDPQTSDFRSRHRVKSSDVLFFNASGELVDRQVALLSAAALVERVQ
jgi:hypothetical protein